MSTQRPIGVGGQTLLHGDKNAGYYGEVTNLITANELRSLTGVTEGTAMQTGDIKFLKYSHNNKTLFVPEKPLQHSISWDYLQSKDLVFGKTLEIEGSLYLVRLMHGSSINPATNYNGNTPPTSVTGQNSEWDSLLVPSAKTWNVVTEDDLGVLTGNGRYTWCQEVHSGYLTSRVVRGGASVSVFSYGTSSSSYTVYGWRPVLELLLDLNKAPSISVSTTDSRTLYEQDTISLTGSATDTDSGDVVTVKYSINNRTVRAISTAISQGTEIPFNKTLTFKSGKLYDGATAVTGDLAEGTQHFFKIFAEDDKGGKSTEITRNFYVVPNRPPKLTLKPFSPSSDLINTDKITIQGNTVNPDENGITVDYKIGNGAYKEVYKSTTLGGDFSFQVPLSDLKVGKNTLTIRSVDYYGATDTKTLDVTKEENLKPLKTAVARYKLSPPNGTANGIVLWIEREVGDLTVDAEIHMGANGEPENFKKMTKTSTAFVREGIEEDEFTFEDISAKENIILKITMNRTSTVSNKGITLISGVLS